MSLIDVDTTAIRRTHGSRVNDRDATLSLSRRSGRRIHVTLER